MNQYPKSILTSQELIQKLLDQDMVISDLREAEKALDTIGYYRLKGYSFQFFNTQTRSYEGTKFEDILKLYQFDQKLSSLLSEYLSAIEVALRSRLVESLLQVYKDALILNDPAVFENKSHYWTNISGVASEIARSKDGFIEHNFKNHDGVIPIWATVEVLSFGTLSKIIAELNEDKEGAFHVLASHYSYIGGNGGKVIPRKDRFKSWTQAITVLRNICAHNGRIYNRTISTIPQIIENDKITPQPRFHGLYEMVLGMKYLRPDDDSWNNFKNRLSALLTEYGSVIEMNRINFPDDWESHLSV